MNWSEHFPQDSPDTEPEGIPSKPVESGSADALFVNDSGELPLDTRRVLVQLLAGPSVDGRRHPKLWPVLVRDETVIRHRLADLFLELVIDVDLQVAFIRQVDTGEVDAPRLLRRAQLTFIDSILLLHLRHLLSQAESHGERAVVSVEEIVEFLHLYERTGSTDRAGFTKRIYASIEKIKKHSILQKIRSSDNRFEISPTLKLLFSAEEIQLLTSLYQRMAAGEVSMDPDNFSNDQGADE